MGEGLDRRRLRMLLGLWGTLAGCTTLGAMIAPVLLVHHPATLVALSPLWRHLILVVPLLDPWTFFAVGLARRMVGVMVFFAFGYLYGQRAIEWVERSWPLAGRWIRWVDRWFRRLGPILVLWPSLTVWVLAGTSRMHPALFGILSAISILATLTLIWTFGELVSEPLNIVLAWLRAHMWEATAVSVCALGAVQLLRLRRRPIRTARDSLRPPTPGTD